MSTDDFMFVNSNQFRDIDLPLFATNEAVAFTDGNQLPIDGLVMDLVFRHCLG